MAGKSLIVEDEVLEFAALNGHYHRTMSRIHWCDHALTPLFEPDSLLVADPSAHPTAETDIFTDLGFLAFVLQRVSRGNHAHRFNRTSFGAFHAAGTFGLGDYGQEVGGADGSENSEPLSSQHSLATASTAVADEGDALAHVLTELH